MKTKPMSQERLNNQFSVMRTGLAITTGVLLSILTILFVSEDAVESVKYLLMVAAAAGAMAAPMLF